MDMTLLAPTERNRMSVNVQSLDAPVLIPRVVCECMKGSDVKQINGFASLNPQGRIEPVNRDRR